MQDGIIALYRVFLKFGPGSTAKCYKIAINTYSIEAVWYKTKDSYCLVIVSLDPFFQIVKGIYPVSIDLEIS